METKKQLQNIFEKIKKYFSSYTTDRAFLHLNTLVCSLSLFFIKFQFDTYLYEVEQRKLASLLWEEKFNFMLNEQSLKILKLQKIIALGQDDAARVMMIAGLTGFIVGVIACTFCVIASFSHGGSGGSNSNWTFSDISPDVSPSIISEQVSNIALDNINIISVGSEVVTYVPPSL